MAFFLERGRASVEWYPKTASTAFTQNELLYSVTGQLLPADSTSGDHIGVGLRTIAATDTTTDFIPVLVPHGDTEFRATDIAGTLTAAMVNTFRDLTDSLVVNVAATAKEVILITQFISATVGLVKVNALAYHRRIATT